ncbi:MAG TPA: hypothetical protein VLD36_00500 [Burkholderiales bacterium]|nr:hypothetical protein [Burkholderiales bacterium]
MRSWAALGLAMLGLALGAGWAVSQERGAPAGRVPMPVIAQAQGEKCVEPADFMRRNHMQVLMFHRDRTMHEGVRTTQHSLKGCVECHAGPKTGTVAGSKDDFCQSCHAYAAVSIDCFECHAPRPKQAVARTRRP